MKLKGWKELRIGGLITEAGNSIEYETGSWRSQRPILDKEKCTSCMLCWIFCPDNSIQVDNGKVISIDLAHCKGCGICSKECPRKAIEMVNEADAAKERV